MKHELAFWITWLVFAAVAYGMCRLLWRVENFKWTYGDRWVMGLFSLFLAPATIVSIILLLAFHFWRTPKWIRRVDWEREVKW